MPVDRYSPFILVALAAALCTSPAGASHPGDGVTLFAAGGYRGASETFYGDVPTLRGSYVGNDHASSLRLAPGCVAVLYEHHDYRGRSTLVDHDVPDLRRTSVGNDAVSSLSVDCEGRGDRRYRDERYRDDRHDRRGRWERGGHHDHGAHCDHGGYRGGVTLYRGGDFSHGYETFFGDVPDLSRTAVGNDHASSVRVSPGCRVVLYRGSHYRGEATVLFDDEPDLRYTAVGNDQVSSIEVDCRR